MCRASMALPVSWKRKYTRTVPPSKTVAEQVFYLVHLRAVAGGYGQEIPGGPSPLVSRLTRSARFMPKFFTGG